MSKHSIIKAGVGIGLMASSLASTAALQTFAEPMVFYKVNGSTVNYVALLPNITDTNVLMLELFQSGSVSTWAYGVGGAVSNAAAGGPVWSLNFSNAAAGNSGSTIGLTANGTSYNAAGELMTFGRTMDATNSGSYATGSSWYGGGTAALTMAFAQVQTISSQVCNATFNLLVASDGNLRFAENSNSWTISASGFPTASGVVTYRSGASANLTETMAATAWNAIGNFTASYAFSTFSAYSVPNAGAVSTFAPSALAKANLCAGIYTGKTGLNAAGNVIGGPTGLVRLW